MTHTQLIQYWKEAALDLTWDQGWQTDLKWNSPHAEWFVEGKLNASVNCLDRHLPTLAQETAIIWEGEPGEIVQWTYHDLYLQTCELTQRLRRLGLTPGDTVAIYMPMIPEAVVAMLACARGGFTHTVIFGGFSSEAIKDRVQDAQAKVIITADYGYRKGARIPLYENVAKVRGHLTSVQDIICFKREEAGSLSHAKAQTKIESRPASVSSEHPLFILYTSGTTGKPKGIVHSTAGYLTGAKRSCEQVFKLSEKTPPDQRPLFWCTADIGWVTGHTYVVYGPLSQGAKLFIYEGAPLTPEPDRFWKMIAHHKINILYTAPTAIRTFMKFGTELVQKHDLSSLQLLGSVGEPINPEAWRWYQEYVGLKRCPVVDTFWQTETGSIVVSPRPQESTTTTLVKPGSASLPLPGYDVDVVNAQGESVKANEKGLLVIKHPWPSMARTIHGDAERFKKTYFSEFLNTSLPPSQREMIYFTGDGAKRDEDGYIWCLGRVDDVLNVSGHRLGTAEIESALISHQSVAESAVVGRPDEMKGQSIVAYVTLKSDFSLTLGEVDSSERHQKVLEHELLLKQHVGKEIGSFARPDQIYFVEGLPKTRSGKIMRRLLRELATTGEIKGDVTTLEDLNSLAAIKNLAESD